MSDIFREIDEELRRENFAKLWSRYGAYILGVAIAIVLATAIFVGWRHYETRQAQVESVRYAAALDLVQKNEPAKAADAFAALARQSATGQRTLARFEEASQRAKAGDPAAAIAIYRSLAGDDSIDPSYRGLARLLLGFKELGTADPKTVIADVEPLTKAGDPWRPSALEVTALAKLRAGDRAGARTIYKNLADDLTAPPALRQRATEMTEALAG